MLVFFIAKFLSLDQMAQYTFFSVIVSYALFVVGLDFYTFASRELLQVPHHKRGQIIKSHVIVLFYAYLLFSPVLLYFTSQKELLDNYIYWLIPILLFEHINQEISRLLISLSEQITSSVIIFIRQGIWPILVLIIMYIYPEMRNLESVLCVWFFSGIIAAFIGYKKIVSLIPIDHEIEIDWDWIKKGLKLSSIFLISTLALRGFQTFDRIWIEHLSGVNALAAYALLYSIANMLNFILEALIFTFSFPKLLSFANQPNSEAYNSYLIKISIEALIIILIFSIVSIYMLDLILKWIDKPIFFSYSHIFPWILSAVIFNAISQIPQADLYSRGLDNSNFLSTVLPFILFIFACPILAEINKDMAVLYSINIAYVLMCTLKILISILNLRKYKCNE
jgi:O-antigen/teichoic acid export membrane protein